MPFRRDVELVEEPATRSLAHLVSGASRLVGRFSAELGLREGDRIAVRAPLERWFLFDTATGRTVRYAS